MKTLRLTLLAFLSSYLYVSASKAEAQTQGQVDYFWIAVVDEDTGSPVGCAKLTSTDKVEYFSDENGIVTFYEPGLMREIIYFHIEAEGYEYPANQFGFRGKAFDLANEAFGVIELKRVSTPGNCNRGTIQTERVQNGVPGRNRLFRIQVVDRDTGRGVPLIELKSPNASYYTDSHGNIAFDDHTLMNHSVDFTIKGHGYRFSPSTVSLFTDDGGTAVIQADRVNIAERLYRITGAGIYRDSLFLDLPVPLSAPALNSKVTGQDTVMPTIYKGKLFWLWGDTNRLDRPLGNFRVTSAVSRLPGQGGLDPEVGVELDYFVGNDGSVKQMAPNATVPGPGPTWMTGLVSVKDNAGREVLFGGYGKYPQLAEPVEAGIARFDDGSQIFEKVMIYPEDIPVRPQGFTNKISHTQGDYIYYDNGVRIRDRIESLLDTTEYELFTAYVSDQNVIQKDGSGVPVYQWRKRSKPITPAEVLAGDVQSEHALFGHLRDPDTFEQPLIKNQSIAWNEARKRYVSVLLQSWGQPSFLGEIWYAEADTPMGPWVYGRKILTHDTYSMYHPRLHPYFNKDDDRTMFFEGTYTRLFSGNDVPTPRYDYNQIMHKIDLSDPRLFLPVAIYDLAGDGHGPFFDKSGLRQDMSSTPKIAFYAPDQEAPGTLPVYQSGAECASSRLVVGGTPNTKPLFYALPSDVRTTEADIVPLYEYENRGNGTFVYHTDPNLNRPGFRRHPQPIARVWRNPIKVEIPSLEYLPQLIADAGADACVVTASQFGVARLDASRTMDSMRNISRYTWHWEVNGQPQAANGKRARIGLPVGTHEVTLEVQTRRGATASDVVVVEVKESGTPVDCQNGVPAFVVLPSGFFWLFSRRKRGSRS